MMTRGSVYKSEVPKVKDLDTFVCSPQILAHSRCSINTLGAERLNRRIEGMALLGTVEGVRAPAAPRSHLSFSNCCLVALRVGAPESPRVLSLIFILSHAVLSGTEMWQFPNKGHPPALLGP